MNAASIFVQRLYLYYSSHYSETSGGRRAGGELGGGRAGVGVLPICSTGNLPTLWVTGVASGILPNMVKLCGVKAIV
jgi:hypothetical protein